MSYRNPVHWRLRQTRYRLVGSVCPHCHRPSFPARPPCCQPGLELARIEEQIQAKTLVIIIDSQIYASTAMNPKDRQNEWDRSWIKGVENEIEAL
jgi:uncharacterized OB-fold protein